MKSITPKFQVGDTITAILPNAGLKNCKILGIEPNKSKRYLYRCAINRGIAYIPASAEDIYQKVENNDV